MALRGIIEHVQIEERKVMMKIVPDNLRCNHRLQRTWKFLKAAAIPTLILCMSIGACGYTCTSYFPCKTPPFERYDIRETTPSGTVELDGEVCELNAIMQRTNKRVYDLHGWISHSNCDNNKHCCTEWKERVLMYVIKCPSGRSNVSFLGNVEINDE